MTVGERAGSIAAPFAFGPCVRPTIRRIRRRRTRLFVAFLAPTSGNSYGRARGHLRGTADQTAHGGGCACKNSPGEFEEVIRDLPGGTPSAATGELLVGLDSGDAARPFVTPISLHQVSDPKSDKRHRAVPELA